jgi:hypothetical protein
MLVKFAIRKNTLREASMQSERIRRVALVAFMSVILTSPATAAYITGSQKVSGTIATPQYGDASLLDNAGNPGPFGPFALNFSYIRSFDGTQLLKDVEIDFVFDAGFTDAQKAAYTIAAETNVEGIWNNKFRILDTDSNIAFPLSVDLTTTGPFDQTVTVHKGAGRGNALNWFEDYTAAVEAHEFGHMLGLFDEYIGGSVNQYPNPTLSNEGLMGLGALNLEPLLLPRYYEQYLDYMNTLNPGYHFTIVAVPEPPTLFLFLTGVVALLGLRKKLGNIGHGRSRGDRTVVHIYKSPNYGLSGSPGLRVCLALVLYFAGSLLSPAAAGAEIKNEYAVQTIMLRDVHPLYGGQNLYLRGDGNGT